MSTVIKVENLSKQYRLGDVGTGTLSHDLKRWSYRLRGKEDPFLKIGEANDRTAKGNSDYVWALQDINFEVKAGEVLGIIGRNGAGKSTLLKILSKTTAPTTGSIKVKGRIASLLEVGTGFHPELSGRENIFLNGAILGMTKQEIKIKFDEIVDFSGVERYIDTPVKRYSSGMYVRLAFAVAAHLEPEILIVDEVLAVGDAEFQKKCLGKMKDVSVNEGRTVLFVSHNMAAVNELCTKGLVLINGSVSFGGTQREAVKYYQNTGSVISNFEHSGSFESSPLSNEKVSILKMGVESLGLNNLLSISTGVRFSLSLFCNVALSNLAVTFELRNIDETIVFHQGVWICENNDSQIGVYELVGEIPPHILNAGIYKFNLIVAENYHSVYMISTDIIQFEVMNESIGGTTTPLPGIIRPNIQYDIVHKKVSV